MTAKPTAAALAAVREIYAREPSYRHEEERIIEAALIADRYMVPREVPHHGDTTDNVREIRVVHPGDKPPLSESEREAFIRVATNPASD